MQDPVIIMSGHTFERKYIAEYFEQKKASQEDSGGDTPRKSGRYTDRSIADLLPCPVTRLMVNDELIENARLKRAIEDFKKKNSLAVFQFKVKR